MNVKRMPQALNVRCCNTWKVSFLNKSKGNYHEDIDSISSVSPIGTPALGVRCVRCCCRLCVTSETTSHRAPRSADTTETTIQCEHIETSGRGTVLTDLWRMSLRCKSIAT